MPNFEPSNISRKSKPENMNDYMKYSGMGFQMVLVIGVFSFAGYKIDEYLHHQVQWVTVILALTGIFVSLYLVFKSLKS